jgi:uncharacterized membrane protein
MTTDFTKPLAASLLSTLTVNVEALGLGLSPAGITRILAGLLAPLGPALDSVIDTTLRTLGLELGVADVEVYGVNCSRPVLVQ